MRLKDLSRFPVMAIAQDEKWEDCRYDNDTNSDTKQRHYYPVTPRGSEGKSTPVDTIYRLDVRHRATHKVYTTPDCHRPQNRHATQQKSIADSSNGDYAPDSVQRRVAADHSRAEDSAKQSTVKHDGQNAVDILFWCCFEPAMNALEEGTQPIDDSIHVKFPEK